jgi:hypothetical protein
MEHRWGRRQATDIDVHFWAPATSGTGRILNVSSTGAYLETSVKLRVCSLVHLEPADTAPPGAARTAAIVVRRTPAGVGLEWCEKDGLFSRFIFPPHRLTCQKADPCHALCSCKAHTVQAPGLKKLRCQWPR